jgi:uncharacterized membrane protein
MGRILEVDALRGAAITMMVAYHIAFDAYYFGIAPVDIFSLPLVLFQRVTGSLFLLIVGISLTISESRNKEGYAHHFKRGLALGAVALGITAATWVFPHDGFITFGIIHMIAASVIIAPFFMRFGRLNVVLGLAVIAIGLSMGGVQTDSHFLFPLGLTYPGYTALDYYPLFPWFGIILIGLYAGQGLVKDGKSAIRLASTRGSELLAFLGRNSLTIYLAHQAVIVGAIFALRAAGFL